MNIITKLINKMQNNMIVQKYEVEGYEDPMHLGGHFKHYEIFVPQYNMIIRLDNHKIVFVSESDKPHNVFHTSFSSKEINNPIEEILINEKFINGCKIILEETKRINALKEDLYVYFDETKPEEQRFKDKHDYYIKQFYNLIHSEKDKALQIFNDYLDDNIKSDNASIYHSIARIYKTQNNEELYNKYKEKYNQIEKE